MLVFDPCLFSIAVVALFCPISSRSVSAKRNCTAQRCDRDSLEQRQQSLRVLPGHGKPVMPDASKKVRELPEKRYS